MWLLQLRTLSPPSPMINIRKTNGRDFGTFVHVLNQIKHLREKTASGNVRESLCLFTFCRFIFALLFSLLVCLEASIFFLPRLGKVGVFLLFPWFYIIFIFPFLFS